MNILSEWRWHVVGAVLLLAIFAVSACDVRDVVFVERPFYKDAPVAAKGFLGYDEADTKLTVCGNCHVGQQATWTATGHADAWEGLQSSGGAQEFCEGCHTVGPDGNRTDDGGWVATKDARYHDVQCESCHGPGEAHVANPTASQPVAGIDVGDLSDLANAKNCAQCHQGTHHPFAEEWRESKHASVVGFAAAREECAGCHRGQGVLARWNADDNYAEKDAPEHLAITCAVCHDPHDATNEGQLRLPVATVSVEQHLCASCHNRRTIPDPNSSHGLEPHAPEAALLSGDAGWFPPNSNINQGEIIATHGSGANAKLCATCHVNMFTVTDEATGDFVFSATGHLFRSIPCLDDRGVPTTDDCELTATSRSFKGCTSAGCHPSEEAAASAMIAAADDIEGLAETLFGLLEQVDPNGEDEGGEIDPRNPTFTVAEGAFFNYHLAEFGGDVYGATAHNPYLIEALLLGSIAAVEDAYGVSSGLPAQTVNQRIEELKSLSKASGMRVDQSFYDTANFGSEPWPVSTRDNSR